MQDKEQKPIKPNGDEAFAILEYISMEDSTIKKIITVLAKTQIDCFLKWIDDYAEKLGITQEEALNQIIEENK